jgi:hypothetical protein
LENPERKILKDLLSKLRVKSLKSQLATLGEIDAILKIAGEILEIINKYGKTEQSERVMTTTLFPSLYALIRRIHNAFGDVKLYVTSLEQYSLALDNTLAAIFDMAKKEEERVKEEQEKIESQLDELRKREPTYID